MDEKKISEDTQKVETVSGDSNLKSALTYAAGWITGLVFLMIEKENDQVRFHAAQSLIVFGALTVVGFVPVLGVLLSPIIAIAALVLWIVLIVQAYQGKRFKLPVIGDYAEQLKGKIG